MKELKTVDECRLNLTNIIKYRKENKKKIASYVKIIEKDMYKIQNNPKISCFSEDIVNQNKIAYDNMKRLTGCKEYAELLAYFEECQKYLALYYIYTEDGKTPDRRADIMEDLLFTYDMMAHATLNYYLFERNESIYWEDYDFYTKEDIKDPFILDYVLDCTINISDLVLAVDSCDNARVCETYNNILKTKMVNPELEPFSEFL